MELFLVIVCIVVYFSWRGWKLSGKKNWFFIGHDKEEWDNSYSGIKLKHPVSKELIIGKRED